MSNNSRHGRTNCVVSFPKQCRISVSYAQQRGDLHADDLCKLLYEMEKGRDTVLATIVWDSAPLPGVPAHRCWWMPGPQAGTIGGGNVENLSILHARELLKAGHGDIRDYKLHRSDTDDIGMVRRRCAGAVHLHFRRGSAVARPGRHASGLHRQISAGLLWRCPCPGRRDISRSGRRRRRRYLPCPLPWGAGHSLRGGALLAGPVPGTQIHRLPGDGV